LDSGRVFHFMDTGPRRRVLDWQLGLGPVRDLGGLPRGETRCSKERNTENVEPRCLQRSIQKELCSRL
jgi:hypothetical protein